MASQFQINQKAATLKRLQEVFKKACKLVKSGSNIKAAIIASGMTDSYFYAIASEEMKKELKGLSMSNKLSLQSSRTITKEHLLFEEDFRCED